MLRERATRFPVGLRAILGAGWDRLRPRVLTFDGDHPARGTSVKNTGFCRSEHCKS
jgi:hypothetical protein